MSKLFFFFPCEAKQKSSSLEENKLRALAVALLLLIEVYL